MHHTLHTLGTTHVEHLDPTHLIHAWAVLVEDGHTKGIPPMPNPANDVTATTPATMVATLTHLGHDNLAPHQTASLAQVFRQLATPAGVIIGQN